jgi:S-adenosylmethionine:tRNA ribosyltransferase-isomerase
VSRATANAIIRAKREGRPVIAVGTTAVRAVESAAAEAVAQGSNDVVVPCSGPTKLLLQPGVPIRAIDGLLTNFHLPKSTLMALVAAFIGVPNLLAAYRHAVAARYRFFSYGDAMLIRRKLPTSAALESVAVASARAEAAQ